MNVYKKLQSARLRLGESDIKKTGKNAFGTGFAYFELRDFMPTTNKLFDEIGLIGLIGLGEDGFATLTVVDTEKPGETIVFTCQKAEAGLRQGTPIQNIGAQTTYLRRYLWLQALELTEDDQVDALADDRKVSSQDYGKQKPHRPSVPKNNDTFPDDLRAAKTIQELSMLWQSIPNMYKVQSLINVKEEMKDKLTPIDQRIVEAKTKEELISVCNTLSPEQETELNKVISDKLDEFHLSETEVETP